MLHMEQNTGFKVVLFLIKEKSHIREIAKSLNINHMAVSRVLNQFICKNIVDYKWEGKNKVYFIKKTSEAKNYLIMAELFNLNEAISKYSRLRRIVEEIQSNKKIKLAILFGSYAKDIPKESSDIDLYIESNNKKLKEEISLIDSKLSIKLGKFDVNSLLIKEIIKNHIILKGVELYYEKLKFFD